VANSSVDFENPNWRNAAYYLAKELAYKPNKAITEDFNTLAIQTIKNELKAVTNDLTASREERERIAAIRRAGFKNENLILCRKLYLKTRI
jgi:hypothetical protein